MSDLGKRLTALEQIAEDMRMRPFRELAGEIGVSVESLIERYDECHARTVQLRAEGKTEREILEATAARMGVDPDELEQERDALVRRFNL